jgi:hypothetical protein
MAPEPAPVLRDEAGRRVEGRRRKVPVSAVVTFVGIALTAWLLPAFTRQWDDRQKAQELKAGIVADMAAATARALVGGEAIWAEPPRKVNRDEIADDWARSSLSIEARLRAYLPPRIVAAWQIYTWMVDRFVDGGRVQAQAALSSAERSLADRRQATRLDPGAASAAASVLNFGRRQGVVKGPSFVGNGRFEQSALVGIEDHLRPYLDVTEDELEPSGLDLVQATLVTYQEELTREVLAAHATGFSTSGRDLLHDLLPG